MFFKDCKTHDSIVISYFIKTVQRAFSDEILSA